MSIARYENEASKSWQENDSMIRFYRSSLSAVNVLSFNFILYSILRRPLFVQSSRLLRYNFL